MNQIVNPTFGMDPEFAIMTSDGEVISGADVLPGSKAEPFDIGDGDGVQPDGVMAEYTCSPVTTKEEFLTSLNRGRNKIDNILSKFDAKTVLLSSYEYDNTHLQHPDCRKFGCEPSYCIYTQSVSPRPSVEEIGNLRTAGFHIHVGTQARLTIEEIEYFIYCMDVKLGVPSMELDTDNRRRALYGNAGDFRFKQLDNVTIMEYRVLGGNMIAHAEFCFDKTLEAIDMYNKSSNEQFINWREYGNETKDKIDTCKQTEKFHLMEV
jgi:hypothetical protein